MATTTDGKKRVVTGITVLGLTGSIGMGKSTVAKMFQKHGIPVLDADKIVHDLYGVGGAAVPLVEAAFPGTTVEGVIWRPKLSTYVIGNEAAMEQLEDIVHPLVDAERRRWLQQLAQEGTVRMAVLDIPLLYETGAEDQVDAVVVVSAPADIQRERVLERPGMSTEKFEAISGRQLADAEKRRRADYVIETGGDIAETEAQVAELVAKLLSP